jgi:lysozyme
MREKLIALLLKHEGLRLEVYSDSVGKPTIGIGRCLSTKGLTKEECDHLHLGTYEKNSVIAKLEVRGISQHEAEYLLSNDIDYFTNELIKSLGYFERLPEMAKIVLLDVCFNCGLSGLLKFKKTLSLIEQGKYKESSVEILNSLWAKQVGNRAIELSNVLKLI